MSINDNNHESLSEKESPKQNPKQNPKQSNEKNKKNSAMRPSPFLMMTEVIRATWDFAALLPSAGLLDNAPRGDQHPVLVIPGFMASDASTYVLRNFLHSLGYKVHGWGLGRNTGPRTGLRVKMSERLGELSQRYDNKKITLIGQSLGGIYARVIANQAPEIVRQVIMLGSPFAGMKSTSRPVQALFQWSSGIKEDNDVGPEIRRMFIENPPLPSTAIYSKLDGIAHWRSCIHKLPVGEETKDHQLENIEVVCSHIGMAFNPATLYAVADRLALPEGQWQPFAKSKANTRLIYPKPEPVEQKKAKPEAA